MFRFKGYDDSLDECFYTEEPDDIFERWVLEQTDYTNHEKIHIEYDEDNPYYLAEDDDELPVDEFN